jgi:hypothetical protein
MLHYYYIAHALYKYVKNMMKTYTFQEFPSMQVCTLEAANISIYRRKTEGFNLKIKITISSLG